jgi:hypothetical protein
LPHGQRAPYPALLRFSRSSPAISPRRLPHVVRVVDVVAFRVTQLVLDIDFKFFRGFRFLIYFAYGRLVFTRVFVVAIIVIVSSPSRWERDDPLHNNYATS